MSFKFLTKRSGLAFWLTLIGGAVVLVGGVVLIIMMMSGDQSSASITIEKNGATYTADSSEAIKRYDYVIRENAICNSTVFTDSDYKGNLTKIAKDSNSFNQPLNKSLILMISISASMSY